MKTRAKFGLGLWCALILVAGVSAPTWGAETAPVIKPMGWPIPSIFFSASEARQRNACADGLAECRPTIRAQMEEEMAYSMILPWVLLGGGILVTLFYLRAQEQKKRKMRMAAQRHHNPNKFKKLGQTTDEKADEAARNRQRQELADDRF